MTKTDIKLYFKQTSGEIEKELNTFASDWNKTIKKDFIGLTTENKKFADSFFGGKILRGTLVKLGYELINDNHAKEILKPAIAFEILHTSLLIHDDIIDQSLTRRGKPAVHIAKNQHYGISQAICLGDLGITLSIKLLSESNFPHGNKNRALNFFLHIISNTILGEMLDVESALKKTRNETQILKIHQMKTADYTIVGPLSVGALLAGANDELLKKIKRFGEPLGIAFQIQDDILGIFGDEKTLGKSTTSDIEENKSTLLITYALERANAKQRTILKQYYGKKNITAEQHALIKQVFKETGSLAYSGEKIKTLTAQAKAIIPDLTKNKDKQVLLTQFTDMLTKRKK